MKALKLTIIAVVGLPVALFVLLVLLGFILALVPFGTIGFIAWKFFAWRTEKERMKRKTEVKLAEMKRNSFPLLSE